MKFIDFSPEVIDSILNYVTKEYLPIYKYVSRYFNELIKNKKINPSTLNDILTTAAENGRKGIMELCKDYGATDFNWAMRCAAFYGHKEIVELCKDWGSN